MTDLEKTAFAKHKAQTRSCLKVMSGRTINYQLYDATRKNKLHKRATQVKADAHMAICGGAAVPFAPAVPGRAGAQ